MNIDMYIKDIDDLKLISVGSNKECYDFGNVVLLKYRCSDDFVGRELNSIIGVKDRLDILSVNSYKIIDYKFVDGFFYVLETKVKGFPIQECKKYDNINLNSDYDATLYYNQSRVSILKYIERLRQLNNINILDKFFCDYISIMDSGIVVDPSKASNFLFDGKKVSFIDLNCYGDTQSYGVNDIVYYMLHIISWATSFDASMDEISEISFYLKSIHNKIISICKKYGYELGPTSFGKTCDDLVSYKISRFINESKSFGDYKSLKNTI